MQTANPYESIFQNHLTKLLFGFDLHSEGESPDTMSIMSAIAAGQSRWGRQIRKIR